MDKLAPVDALPNAIRAFSVDSSGYPKIYVIRCLHQIPNPKNPGSDIPQLTKFLPTSKKIFDIYLEL